MAPSAASGRRSAPGLCPPARVEAGKGSVQGEAVPSWRHAFALALSLAHRTRRADHERAPPEGPNRAWEEKGAESGGRMAGAFT